MYYQLKDMEAGDNLGVIRVTNIGETPNFEEEIKESWNDYNVLEEHEFDNCNVDDFVKWHNENYVTQIERIFLRDIW